MTKEEKLDKILEMSKEIMLLKTDQITDKDIDELYIQTKIMLEAIKELEGSDK